MREHEFEFQYAMKIARERRSQAVKTARAELNRDLRQVYYRLSVPPAGQPPADALTIDMEPGPMRQTVERAWDRYHVRLAAIWTDFEHEMQQEEALYAALSARITRLREQLGEHMSEQEKAIKPAIQSSLQFRKPRYFRLLRTIRGMKHLFH
jgi:hypothetical protein